MNAPRLLSLAEILPAGLVPVEPVSVSPAEALGAIAAEDLALPEGWPRTSLAREPGYAIASRMLIGATAYEPALLPASTPLLKAGEPLPDRADAILPAASVAVSPMGLEAFATIRPGEGVRRAGQDWPAGRLLLKAGARIGPVEQAMMLAMEVPTIRIRRAAVSLDPALPEAIRGLLSRWAESLGAVIVPAAQADLRLEACAFAEPRLALRPGRFGSLAADGPVLRLAIPPDLAEATGLWHALALPLLAQLSGAALHAFQGQLAGKLVSGIGYSELAFLRREGDGWLPLETGDCTLATLAEAEAVLVMPAGSEGQPAGSEITLMPFGGAFLTMRDRSFAR